jgi:hypothetical protein
MRDSFLNVIQKKIELLEHVLMRKVSNLKLDIWTVVISIIYRDVVAEPDALFNFF